mmetsp:Transcript_8104/g.11291  ORF Transcript_8104/g.11291 Transcript_8104/m.11291 type:complete len:232 (-) Transcript_8104:162-857(-)
MCAHTAADSGFTIMIQDSIILVDGWGGHNCCATAGTLLPKPDLAQQHPYLKSCHSDAALPLSQASSKSGKSSSSESSPSSSPKSPSSSPKSPMSPIPPPMPPMFCIIEAMSSPPIPPPMPPMPPMPPPKPMPPSRALVSKSFPASSSSSSTNLSQSICTCPFSSALFLSSRPHHSSASLSFFMIFIWILLGSTFHTLPSVSTSCKNSRLQAYSLSSDLPLNSSVVSVRFMV